MQAIQQGNPDIARIHAGNSIRKEQERLNLLRLASRIDAVASRVRTAVTMRNVKRPSNDMLSVGYWEHGTSSPWDGSSSGVNESRTSNTTTL